MPPIHHAVLRGAVPIILIAAAGCHDSPMQPNVSTVNTAVAVPHAATPNLTLTGKSADSVVSMLEGYWAANGHPEYREARLAWRKRNGIPERIKELADRRAVPNADLVDGTQTEKPHPQILSHFESLYFGRNDAGLQLPSGVNAEMTFIGDVGDIELSGLTIRRNDGSQYSTGGRIATGGGTLVDCREGSATCGNRRWLEGALLLSAAPTCDATGNGTVSYYANNAGSLGLIGSTSFSTADGATSASGQVGGSAPACVPPPPPPPPKDGGEDIGGDGTGAGGTGSSGGTSGQGTESWPAPPPEQPAPTHPVGWDCSGVVMSQLIGDEQVYLAEAYVCRPIYY